MAIVVYVDDVLFFCPDSEAMEDVINELQQDSFELMREKVGDDYAYNFLGINILQEGGRIKKTQPGLINKVLTTVGMENCNASTTPCNVAPLGTNVSAPIHSED